jgi:hypothetical protein
MTAEMAHAEVGHPFYAALQQGLSSLPDHVKENGKLGVPAVISRLTIEAGLPSFANSPCVFMGGRVYRNVTSGKSGVDHFSELDPWREEVREQIAGVGAIPLDGLALDLHDQDVYAGAGRALFNTYLSPIGVFNGIGRMGPATIEEARFILSLGGNVGLIVDPAVYPDVISFLNGKSRVYPETLPSYLSLDLQPRDIICGVEKVGEWVVNEQKTLSSRAFGFRQVPKNTMTQIAYYNLYYAQNRPDDIEIYNNIQDRLNQH